MEETIYPTEDRVLLRHAPIEQKTASGIYLPTKFWQSDHRGIVVAVGPGTKDTPTSVKAGDTVLYQQHIARPLAVKGEELLHLRENAIYATESGGSISPVGARVLVRYDKASEFLSVENDLIIPEAYRKEPLRGTVVKVGAAEGMALMVGDRVAFRWNDGTQALHEGVAHLVILEDDVLCILPDEEKEDARSVPEYTPLPWHGDYFKQPE